MAALKRLCAASPILSAVRRFSTTGGVADGLLGLLEPHLADEEGRRVLSFVRQYLREEKEEMRRKEERLREENEERLRADKQERLRIAERERKLYDRVREDLQRERKHYDRACEDLQRRLCKAQVDLLIERGLNDTRGLFEHLEEWLAAVAAATSSRNIRLLSGTPLWEAILSSGYSNLAARIEACTQVRATDVALQALQCYGVYSSLSEYLHEGKSLAKLEVSNRGVIMFERGPLSSQQVKVFECIAEAAHVRVQPLQRRRRGGLDP